MSRSNVSDETPDSSAAGVPSQRSRDARRRLRTRRRAVRMSTDDAGGCRPRLVGVEIVRVNRRVRY